MALLLIIVAKFGVLKFVKPAQLLVCKSGLAAPFSEQELKQKLDAPDCEIRVLIRGNGKGMARFWTCDLTEDYIRINASYRT